MEEQNKQPAATPMGRVWMIVIGSMLFVALASCLWHFMTLSELRAKDAALAQDVERNIAKLTIYRDKLLLQKSTTTTTSKQHSL